MWLKQRGMLRLARGLGCVFICFLVGDITASDDDGRDKRSIQGLIPFDDRKDFLNYVLTSKTFENFAPPNYDKDEPTSIECSVHVENFDTISEANMDFTVTLLLHLTWFDHRLAIYDINNMNDFIEIDSVALDRFWVPDLYFPNEKSAYYHNVLMPNRVLRIYKDAEVTYSTRLSLTLSCQMNFRRYPFDVQKCRIETESFSYNDGDIILRWANESSPVHIDSYDLPQFKIVKIETFESTDKRRGQGNHSMITLEFTFSRNIGYYLVQMYIPSALVVMLSWISFWLNVNAVPGRISLGVLTVLTMTTQSSAVNASLPHVSYTKAIDIWMSTCLIFVFLALIEFAVANVLTRKGSANHIGLAQLCNIPRKKKEKIVDEYSKERDTEYGEGTSSAKKKKTLSSGVRYAMFFDVGSRLVFPAVFIVFNVVYWTYYLNEELIE